MGVRLPVIIALAAFVFFSFHYGDAAKLEGAPGEEISLSFIKGAVCTSEVALIKGATSAKDCLTGCVNYTGDKLVSGCSLTTEPVTGKVLTCGVCKGDITLTGTDHDYATTVTAYHEEAVSDSRGWTASEASIAMDVEGFGNTDYAEYITSMNRFKEITREHKVVLASFYAPWCYWSNKLKPAWEKVASVVQQSPSDWAEVKIVKIDCTNLRALDELCRSNHINAYPSIISFRNGVLHSHEHYVGDRTVDSLLKYVWNLQISEKIKDKDSMFTISSSSMSIPSTPPASTPPRDEGQEERMVKVTEGSGLLIRREDYPSTPPVSTLDAPTLPSFSPVLVACSVVGVAVIVLMIVVVLKRFKKSSQSNKPLTPHYRYVLVTDQGV